MPGAQGEQGPQSDVGPQGPAGPEGRQGEGPAPAGYTFVGTFDLAPSGAPRGRPMMMAVDVYRRN